ncbi:NAD-dependent aldehyde dehydrogenase [Sesbania bispinosa]|nr:NAD-dependent aldehyde dehydrogenase [Sesbania bispinosa]
MELTGWCNEGLQYDLRISHGYDWGQGGGENTPSHPTPAMLLPRLHHKTTQGCVASIVGVSSLQF